MEKIITIELEHNGCTLFETENGIETVIETLKPEIEQAIKDVDEDEEIEFIISVKRTRTQNFIKNLPEFDGF